MKAATLHAAALNVERALDDLLRQPTDADTCAATELDMWASNDGADIWHALQEASLTILRKVARVGEFSPELAGDLMSRTLIPSAKRYAACNCTRASEWSSVFPPDVRKLAGLAILQHFAAEVALGNYDDVARVTA